MADEYKDPNTDIMKALSKAVDAATGETGTQYEYKNPNTDVIQKLEELIEAIATSGGGGHNYSTTEHVVGTWIDGSTIYEKTFVLPSQVRTVENSWSTITGLTLSGNEDIIVETEIYLSNDKSCKIGLGKKDNGVFKYFDTLPLLIDQVTIRYTKTST